MEQLIDLLEESSFLWDVSNKDYYLRKKRERAYKQIEEKLGTERAVIKAKITTLRQQCWQFVCMHNATSANVTTTPTIVGPNNVVTCCVRLHGPSETMFNAFLQQGLPQINSKLQGIASLPIDPISLLSVFNRIMKKNHIQ